MIYLDSAATTLQKPPEVARAVRFAMRHYASVGRGGYAPAAEAAAAVYACREQAAALFDAAPEQVVFTHNATHALNIAVHSLLGAGDHVVISGFEHNAVLRPLSAIGAEIAVAGRCLFRPEDTLRAFAEAITPETKAVVCTHVSNVFGYILPVARIAALCRARGVPLVIDASQSAGLLPLHLRALPAAFIAMAGHKTLYGPQGTGILLCNHPAKALLQGGTGSLSESRQMPDFLPDQLEAGTQNVAGVCGLAAGLRYVQRLTPARLLRHEQGLREQAAAQLRRISGVEVFTETASAAQTGILSFRLAGRDCEQLAQVLARRGICVRAGLHCAPLAHESAATSDTGTVRVSFSGFNTAQEILHLTRAVRAAAGKNVD